MLWITGFRVKGKACFFSCEFTQSKHLPYHRQKHTPYVCLPHRLLVCQRRQTYFIDPAALPSLVWSHLICPVKAFEKRRGKEKKVSAVSTVQSINQGSIKPLSSSEPYVCQSAKHWCCVITRRQRNLDRGALRMLTSTNGLGAWTWF